MATQVIVHRLVRESRITYNRVPTDHFGSWSQWLDGLRFLDSCADGDCSDFIPTPATQVLTEEDGCKLLCSAPEALD